MMNSLKHRKIPRKKFREKNKRKKMREEKPRSEEGTLDMGDKNFLPRCFFLDTGKKIQEEGQNVKLHGRKKFPLEDTQKN